VLGAAADARLEWLPQETILFDGARLRRETTIDAAPGARVLAGEILVLGRVARGERLTRGLVRECWTVHRAGRPVWADALHLDGDIGETTRRFAVLGAAAAFATAVHVADDAPQQLDEARRLLGSHDRVRAAATAVNGILVLRWVAADPADLRAAFADFWRAFRAHLFARPAALPRLWHI
jgi:urease accessory protein